MNISGNYESTERELDVVKKLFDYHNISYSHIIKYPQRDDGDVLVVLPNNHEILIEVKEEAFENRFSNYGDLGIDYISAFYFKNNLLKSKWKGLHKGFQNLQSFLDSIDRNRSFKPGKIDYSKSDLWLFFSVDRNNTLRYFSFFDGVAMLSDEFFNHLSRNCYFAINNKSAEQLSRFDSHSSACFFINHKDPFLNKYQVDLVEYIKKA